MTIKTWNIFLQIKNFNNQNFVKFIRSIEQRDTLDKKGI